MNEFLFDHAKARSREVPMREGQFLPRGRPKKAVSKEKAEAKPGKRQKSLFDF